MFWALFFTLISNVWINSVHATDGDLRGRERQAAQGDWGKQISYCATLLRLRQTKEALPHIKRLLRTHGPVSELHTLMEGVQREYPTEVITVADNRSLKSEIHFSSDSRYLFYFELADNRAHLVQVNTETNQVVRKHLLPVLSLFTLEFSSDGKTGLAVSTHLNSAVTFSVENLNQNPIVIVLPTDRTYFDIQFLGNGNVGALDRDGRVRSYHPKTGAFINEVETGLNSEHGTFTRFISGSDYLIKINTTQGLLLYASLKGETKTLQIKPRFTNFHITGADGKGSLHYIYFGYEPESDKVSEFQAIDFITEKVVFTLPSRPKVLKSHIVEDSGPFLESPWCHFRNLLTGEIEKTFPVSPICYASPVTLGKKVLVVSSNHKGELRAFILDFASEKVLYPLETTGRLSEAKISPDGSTIVLIERVDGNDFVRFYKY